jgi:hypothetical protein
MPYKDKADKARWQRERIASDPEYRKKHLEGRRAWRLANQERVRENNRRSVARRKARDIEGFRARDREYRRRKRAEETLEAAAAAKANPSQPSEAVRRMMEKARKLAESKRYGMEGIINVNGR